MPENIPPAAPSGPDVDGPSGGDGAMDGLPLRFGKYTLIRKLAVGGMAELFLAIQRSVAGFEKLIVIKRILPAMNQDRAFIDMLLHEARVAATLSHPNIVQIFDVGQVDGTYFIAMEHVHGEDLRSIVRQMKKKSLNEFPLEHAICHRARHLRGPGLRAREARSRRHAAQHRPPRHLPQNVVVTFTGDVKIVDFGIAKSDARWQGDTKSGRLKGKVPYMSPEQARGEGVDWRSDIFAAGVDALRAHDRKAPLQGGQRVRDAEARSAIATIRCRRRCAAGYPPELEAIVMRALAKDRDERYQSAREMQQALEEFVRRERIPVSTIALNALHAVASSRTSSPRRSTRSSKGKQLADIIELQHSPESGEDGGRPSQSILSTPAASRTPTQVRPRGSDGAPY